MDEQNCLWKNLKGCLSFESDLLGTLGHRARAILSDGETLCKQKGGNDYHHITNDNHFAVSSFVMPRLQGYASSGFALFSVDSFVLIDGWLITIGLLFITMGALIKIAFEMQNEMDEIFRGRYGNYSKAGQNDGSAKNIAE